MSTAHEHVWIEAQGFDGGMIYDCGCGERRIRHGRDGALEPWKDCGSSLLNSVRFRGENGEWILSPQLARS